MKIFLSIITIISVMTNISLPQTDEFNSKIDSLFSKYDFPNPGAAVEIISHGR